MDTQTAKQFISAGNAIFTIENKEGKHYTFKVRRMEDNATHMILDTAFISLLTGPENTKNYTYLGILDLREGTVRRTRNSKIEPSAISWKVAEWLIRTVWQGKEMPIGYKLHHEGKCGRCGRLLTVPSSIESGLGPDCQSILGLGT